MAQQRSIMAGELAHLLGGVLVGDPKAVIERFDTVNEAGPGAVTFISNKKYYVALKATRATLVLVPKDIDQSWRQPGVNLLVHDNPYLALARGMQVWFREP